MNSGIEDARGAADCRISVCILSYNTADLLRKCLESVMQFVVPLGAEVIVVDNASRDGSVEMVQRCFPSVTLIVNAVNHFFTGGVNQAAAVARGQYLLFLNSDVFMVDDSVRALVDALDANPRCAAAEGLTLDPATHEPRLTARRHTSVRGEIARFALLGRPLRRTPFYAALRYRDADPFGTWAAEVACNCFMLMRRDAFEGMGRADESLLVYYSEDDWAQELAKRGLVQCHVGAARAYHAERGSTDRMSPVLVEALYFHDRFAYMRKHHGLVAALLTTIAILTRRNLLRAARVVWTWHRVLPRRVPEDDARGEAPAASLLGA